MPLFEPTTRPEIFADWPEWREHFDYIRAEYIAGEIDRVRLRAMLVMMGYVPGSVDLEREMDAAVKDREKTL